MNITTAPVSSPVIERAKKLLALSQSDNPHERDQAIARANALIAEHKIDMVLLESVDAAKPEEFAEHVVTFGRRRPVESKFISWILHRHFRVDIVNNWKRDGGRILQTLSVIGRKSDSEFALWLAGYLQDEFRRRWDYFKKSTSAPASERSTFLYGVYQGLDQRLTEESKAIEEQRFSELAAVGTTTDGIADQPQTADQLRGRYTLAVQSEETARSAALRRMYPSLRRGRAARLNLRSSSALTAGQHAGRSISTNRPLAA